MNRVQGGAPAPGTVTVADVWAIYYPGQTSEEAYRDAIRRQDERGELHRHALAVSKELDPWRGTAYTAEEIAAHWERVADAWRALARFDGVPDQYISKGGHPAYPADVCVYCWQGDVDGTDTWNGRWYGFHNRCATLADIRSDLRSAGASRVLSWGTEERAVAAEQRALAAHLTLQAATPVPVDAHQPALFDAT